MQEHPAATRDLASLPFLEIGNHTYIHPHLRQLSEERIREELHTTQLILDTLTGRRGRLFRPPYGEYDERVLRIAAELGQSAPDAHESLLGQVFGLVGIAEHAQRQVKCKPLVPLHQHFKGSHIALTGALDQP